MSYSQVSGRGACDPFSQTFLLRNKKRVSTAFSFTFFPVKITIFGFIDFVITYLAGGKGCRGPPTLFPAGLKDHREGKTLPHGEGNGTPLQYFAWKIPWMEEPGRLQSMRSRRVGHD